MDTVHFRIDSETKRLAMRAAKRQQTDLTKLMRLKAEELAAEELAAEELAAEELAAEEREYQKNSHAYWLESEIEKAITNSESGQTVFIEHNESQNRMALLRTKLCGGSD